MKTVIILCLLATAACSTFGWKDPTSPEQLAKVKNYTQCSSDAQCEEGQYCGYVCIDCVAVCKDGGHDTAFNSNELLVSRK